MTAPRTTPTRTSSPRRGLDGALVKVWGGKDLRLRVLEREDVAEDFVRLRMDLDGLLERDEVYPTYWLRLWFTTASGRGHQRAYTLVSPDAAAGTAWIEFFLHDGTASQWARTARPGDEIDATVLGGRNPVATSPEHLLLVGDGCSYPAIADTLRRRPDIPATVLLEQASPAEAAWTILPEREHLTVRRLEADGSIVGAALTAAAAAPERTVTVVALEGAPTRALSGALRKQLGLPKEQVHALAYWKRR
ncbi:siderophore-interacting protein [Brachybacterium sp. AOP43-C2-M15]|uniref:siderophore-interacting protein n=1 Tax=Brachybacterium sp. AOP43-C2-M15 TaxID=3457661 RepID=UPI0040347EAC